MSEGLAEAIGNMARSRCEPKAVLAPGRLREVVANMIRNTFGEETGALGDWPDLVDPDTARAVPKVADNVIILVLTNIGARGHLADYLAEDTT